MPSSTCCLSREEDEERLSSVLRQHKREYERLQQAFRAANLAARRATDVIAARRRAELLAGGDPAARHLNAAAEGDLTAASAGITDALRRTARTMAQVRQDMTPSPVRVVGVTRVTLPATWIPSYGGGGCATHVGNVHAGAGAHCHDAGGDGRVQRAAATGEGRVPWPGTVHIICACI